jgi:hypothetical protein
METDHKCIYRFHILNIINMVMVCNFEVLSDKGLADLPERSLAHWLFSASEAVPELATTPSQQHSASVGPVSKYSLQH